MGETPPNCRRTGRKRKPSFLSAEYQELRRLVRKGEPDPLKVFLGTLDQDFVNVQDSEGCSLLNEIAIKTAQFVKIAEILISFKADVNLCDGMGNSPLHNSLMYYPATHDMAQLLIQHGADVNLRNKCGIVPVQMSDDEDLKKYIQSLRKGVDQLTALNIWLKTVQGPMQVCFETPPPPAGSCPVSPSSSAPSTSTLPATPMVSAGGGRGLKRPRQEEDDESSEEMDVTESCTSKKLRFVMHDSLGTPLKG